MQRFESLAASSPVDGPTKRPPAARATLLCLALFGLFLGSRVEAADPPVSFSREIAPVLIAKCLACHGPEKAKGNYRADTFAFLMKPGDSELPPVVAGHADQSHWIALFTAEDEDDRMPQKDQPLPAEVVARVRRWIDEGAVFDGPGLKAGLASYAGPSDHPAPPTHYARPVPILAVSFEPEGERLAVGGYHEVMLWQPREGTLLGRLTNIAERTQSLAWAPQGKQLAVAGGDAGRGGDVRLFDVKSGALLRLLCRTPDVMLSVAFDPDGARLAAAGADNTIRIFNLTNGVEEIVIEQHSDWVMDVVFSPDGKYVASASRDKTARVFDVRTGEQETGYQEHDYPVMAVAFGEDGKQLFSAGKGRSIHVWSLAEGKKQGEIGGVGEAVYRLVRAGGDLFSCSSDATIRQHRMGGKRELVRTFAGYEDLVYALDVHPPSKLLATGGFDGEVRIWNLEDGALVRKFVAAP